MCDESDSHTRVACLAFAVALASVAQRDFPPRSFVRSCVAGHLPLRRRPRERLPLLFSVGEHRRCCRAVPEHYEDTVSVMIVCASMRDFDVSAVWLEGFRGSLRRGY